MSALGPRYAAQYARLARWLDALRRRVFAFSATRAEGCAPCAQACGSVDAFGIVFLGMLVPCAVLAAHEEAARLDFLVEHGGSPFYASLRGALLYSAAVAPFADAIAAAATGG